MDNTNKLTIDEIEEIAYRLDDVISDHFHDAMYNVIWERGEDEDDDFEVSDEDILRIKEQLRLIL